MTYGDIFKKNEEQMSAYNFTHAQKNFCLILSPFDKGCDDLIKNNLPLPPMNFH